ncbi:aldehyde dehydrogenase family protein [Priestia megaterium]|uniref:aldehyde dehydrogenase family protein n=1 Tax=Priestia megaterium TaxID=1404 RepID=UPI0012B787F5|nr:aldehyde dehydrogenase family protein [Priestia megaterium]
MKGQVNVKIDKKQAKPCKREIINPATNKIIAEVFDSSLQQVEEAVGKAKQAFEQSEWKKNKSLRVAVLTKLADLLEKEASIFAETETLNTGKPIKEAQLDIEDTINCLRYYANLIEENQPWTKNMFDDTNSKIIQEPIGVCALIVPWNFPLLLGMWKLAPALAAGNTVVFKPSELTPLSFLKLASLCKKAGIPEGVFNLLTGDGEVGSALVEHNDVAKVSFTGGSETGKRIYQQCAKEMKRVSLELGGKSPLLIFEDSEIDIAVDWTMFGSFFNQGQVCVASSRILVHKSIYNSFLSALTEAVAAIKIGNPLREETEMGPVISKEHLNKIQSFIKLGQEEGANLLTGGTLIDCEGGNYITPAVLIDVEQHMKVVQEEIFGPVITVQSFSSEEEAIALANGTRFGLAAGILTNDLMKAERVAEQLQAGTIWINGYHTPHIETAWGGFKESGIGRELGPSGLAAFTETKHVNTNSKLARANWYQ